MNNSTIYAIHQSLVNENIITNQKVRECSTTRGLFEIDYVNRKPYYKRILRCRNDNGCPICSYKRDRILFARVSPYVETIKKYDGDIHLLTFNLRHNPSHQLKDLQEVLHKSVKQFRKTYPYKKFYGTKDRLFSLTQYETSWSPHSGFHYHAHCHIGTTNLAPKEQI